jgi:hypothetical protein
MRASIGDLSGRLTEEHHLKSLIVGLRHAQSGILYVLDALTRWEDCEWALVESTVARELSTAMNFLTGVVEGLLILDRQVRASGLITRGESTSDRASEIQRELRGLRSSAESGERVELDFWTLADFWRHYFPCAPKPSQFRGAMRDLQIQISDDAMSGPLLRNLIIPAFNSAYQICCLMGESMNVAVDNRLQEICTD